MQYSNRHSTRYKKQEPSFCELHKTHEAAMLYHWLQVSLSSPNSDDNDIGLGSHECR